MKKLVSLILILCMACMLVPAMADDVAGVWYLKTMKMGDVSYDAEEMGLVMTLVLDEENNAVMSMAGEESKGTWTMDGDTITVTIDNEPVSGSLTADGLLLADDSQETLFIREAISAITVADVTTAASAEEFYGEWNCKYADADGTIASLSGMGITGPSMTIAEDGISFSGNSDAFALLGLIKITPVFADGALTCASATDGLNASGTVEKLTDGMIKLTLSLEGTTMSLYFAPAAAAEEPAA